VTERLELPFGSRGLEGVVRVELAVNDDPEATGHGLIATDFDRDAFAGFPIASAEIDYPGRGPRGIFYWLQTVHQELADGGREAAVDSLYPPFYLFGYRPPFMDAPANPGHPDMDWEARTFLVEDPRVVGSSTFKPLTGFVWGYRLRGGKVERLLELRPADPADWEALGTVYAAEYPDVLLEPFRPTVEA
jgi:hypothetical protein